ncbi:MAG: universal stress protein [Rhodospirillales bacterium]|jgi:nucleotide-binding universal stress UspA family protein|nr:universal stress protein [Rhodospirillales bacterium]
MFKHILLPVDLNSEHSWRKALPVAVENCKNFGATLHVITVVPDVGGNVAVAQFFPDGYEDKMLEQAHDDLHAFSAREISEGVRVQHIISHGSIYKEILDAAVKVRADLILMAAHGPGLGDYLIGPNAARVVRHANCSVMVVRD